MVVVPLLVVPILSPLALPLLTLATSYRMPATPMRRCGGGTIECTAAPPHSRGWPRPRPSPLPPPLLPPPLLPPPAASAPLPAAAAPPLAPHLPHWRRSEMLSWPSELGTGSVPGCVPGLARVGGGGVGAEGGPWPLGIVGVGPRRLDSHCFLPRCTCVFKMPARCVCESCAAWARCVWLLSRAYMSLVWLSCPSACVVCVVFVGPGCILVRDFRMCPPFKRLLCRLARTAVTARRVLVRGCRPCGVLHLFIYFIYCLKASGH